MLARYLRTVTLLPAHHRLPEMLQQRLNLTWSANGDWWLGIGLQMYWKSIVTPGRRLLVKIRVFTRREPQVHSQWNEQILSPPSSTNPVSSRKCRSSQIWWARCILWLTNMTLSRSYRVEAGIRRGTRSFSMRELKIVDKIWDNGWKGRNKIMGMYAQDPSVISQAFCTSFSSNSHFNFWKVIFCTGWARVWDS